MEIYNESLGNFPEKVKKIIHELEISREISAALITEGISHDFKMGSLREFRKEYCEELGIPKLIPGENQKQSSEDL